MAYGGSGLLVIFPQAQVCRLIAMEKDCWIQTAAVRNLQACPQASGGNGERRKGGIPAAPLL